MATKKTSSAKTTSTKQVVSTAKMKASQKSNYQPYDNVKVERHISKNGVIYEREIVDNSRKSTKMPNDTTYTVRNDMSLDNKRKTSSMDNKTAGGESIYRDYQRKFNQLEAQQKNKKATKKRK